MSPSPDPAEVIADLLARGHSVRFTALGDSMYPLVRSGDLLQVDPVAPADVLRGDVVLVRLQRGLTAHRVAAVRGSVVTRGDNASVDDDPVPNVLGRVTALEREGRRIRVSRLSGVPLSVTRFWQRVRLRLRRF